MKQQILLKKPNRNNFKHLIILPMVLALAGLLATAIYFVYQLQQSHIHREIRNHLESVQGITESHLAAMTQALSGIMAFVKQDTRLQDGWRSRDRRALLLPAKEHFERILIDQRITHFYFIDLDRTCFLRVHKPEFSGDVIQRSTLDRSQMNQAPASGFELGPLGTLTLRVVHPWWINGEITGYIELGVEIENVAPKLKSMTGSDLIFTIDKKNLDRTRWEDGMKMIGRAGQWDRFSHFVVISQTLPDIPSVLDRYIGQRKGDRANPIFDIAHGSRRFGGGFVPLMDAGNKVIGDIIVLKDITEEANVLRSLTVTMIASGVTGAILFLIFYIFTGRIEKRLYNTHQDLTAEIAGRKRAQNGIQRLHDKMETRVMERTEELSLVNTKLQQQVSECELAEAALRESEEKYSTLVEDALIGVYVVQDEKIRFANQKFAKIFGYSREELLGMDSLMLIHADDRDMVLKIRGKRLEHAEAPSVYEVRGLRKNGDIIWLLRSNSVIQYQDKPAVAGSVMEITTRKLAEARLQESEKEHQILSGKLLSAEENERKKIAREVHDSIGQSLSAIKYGLENSISRFRGRLADDELRHLEAMVPLTQKSIEEIRRIAMDLRPSILDDLGILSTINWFCREFETIYSGISVQKKIDAREDAIPVVLKTSIYRILQEALNNVAKHSHAHRVTVGLAASHRQIDLLIADNGIGFDVKLALQPTRRGFGLASMKKRAEITGGMFELDANPGDGTRIRISWLRKDQTEDVNG